MLSRQPSLESVRILEVCVRHQSFTRASAELGLTPAAVSLRMRDLEADLGTQLFKRTGPRLRATDAALTLAASVAEAMRTIRSAVEACRGQAEPVRLTTTPVVASWLAPRLHRYHARSPAARLQLDASMELRRGDSFDVAIRSGDPGPWQDFDAIPFATTRSEPMLSPTLARDVELSSPADLARLPLLPHEDWERWFARAGLEHRRLHFISSYYPTYELDAAAAVAGIGVALLPTMFFSSWLKSGQLIQPFDTGFGDPEDHMLLIRQKDARPGVQELRTWLLEEIGRAA
jgi:LysR family glycine cleavage system transcriptional activator